jgi:Phage terminase large subunit
VPKVKVFSQPLSHASSRPCNVAGRSAIARRLPKKQELVVEPITPTEFQQRVINCTTDLVLPGGRGGGKSYGVAQKIADEVNQYGEDFCGLYIRKTYKGIKDFEGICRKVFRSLCPGARYQRTEKVWTFRNGATLELNQLEHEKDYDKFQGRSFSRIIVDEAGQYASPKLIDLLTSNLRGKKGIALSRILIANPGGVGHAWIMKRYINGRTPGQVYFEPETERECMTLVSTYLDNPKIDQERYRKNLISATANDTELQRSYVDGDWNIARGAFFASVLDAARSKAPSWRSLPKNWMHFLGMDYGTAAPCAVYLAAISPGAEHEGKFYPRGSIVLADELYMAQPKDPSKGLFLTVPEQAELIKGFCQRWNISPQNGNNIADDACFSKDGRDSIAEEFQKAGVFWRAAKKGARLPGWEHLRTMMRQAGSVDLPGLYVTEACSVWWDVMPLVPRSEKNPWDVDTGANDHSADDTRYICLTTLPKDSVQAGTAWG